MKRIGLMLMLILLGSILPVQAQTVSEVDKDCLITRFPDGVVKTGACLASGVGFAYMTGTLNTMGILIPDLLTPALTLPYLQLLIIVFFGIIGVIL